MPRREIRRGEIYWTDWNPGRGSEQRGVRPALIIQNDLGNQSSPTTIVASISTALEKRYPFLVMITSIESGLQRDSTVNLSAIQTVDLERLGNKCGELSQAKMAEVDEAIRVSLGV
ncbi:MAG: type II toxin-antitoxin system PemK/MazF family toxin [Chloroflexi bacterium]|nr:type II toxin-antitoxin system PemK/MazF family toxin [Chloroflexota bacterium]